MFENISDRIDYIRAEKGLTTKEVAKRAGITPNAIYQLKKSKRHHPITIRKIADALDVSVRELCGRKD